jgi:hypothetical protein
MVAHWARIGRMGSEWGMNFLLGTMSFCQLLSYLKGTFMPCFPTQIVQSRAKISIWLSLAIAVLVLIASSAGIFIKSIYARETMAYAVLSIGEYYPIFTLEELD